LGHERQELLVVHRPEEVLQIGVNDPFKTLVYLLPNLSQRILRRSSRTVSEVGIIEYRLEDRRQPVLQRLLADTIENRRYAKCARLPRLPSLGNKSLTNRKWLVRVGLELMVKSVEMLIKVLCKLLQALSVDSSRSSVPPNSLPS